MMFNVLGRAVRCHQCSKSQEAAKVRMFFKSLQLLRIVTPLGSWMFMALCFTPVSMESTTCQQSHTV